MTEVVVYCPECDQLHIATDTGFAFKDEGGPFYLMFEYGTFKTHKMYIVGEL